LRLEQGDSAGAETDLRMAIDLAREMGANAYELRAGLDLARLLRACGRISESRALLEPIRAGFAADDENLELRDADEVLARLGA
jgi:hypothetical protein